MYRWEALAELASARMSGIKFLATEFATSKHRCPLRVVVDKQRF